MSEADIVKVILGLLGPVSAVVAGILIVALVGLGTYLRRYLEQKALQLATREDFQLLQKQVAESTRLVEGIKSELANEDWVRRELHGLRARKIEELVTLVLHCADDMDAARNSAVEGRHYDKPRHHDRIEVVATVYLPELVPMTKAYRLELLKYFLQVGHKMIEANQGGGINVWGNFIETSNYQQVLSTRDTLTSEAAKLLQEIVNGTVFRQSQGQD